MPWKGLLFGLKSPNFCHIWAFRGVERAIQFSLFPPLFVSWLLHVEKILSVSAYTSHVELKYQFDENAFCRQPSSKLNFVLVIESNFIIIFMPKVGILL